MVQYILLTLRKRFDDYGTRGEIFRAKSEEMLEQRLHVGLWELLIAIMKIIIETLDITVDGIDACINRIINSDKLKRILELIPPNHKKLLTSFYLRNLSNDKQLPADAHTKTFYQLKYRPRA